MSYEQITKRSEEYSGESYAESLKKKNGKIWAATETATYEMINTSGDLIASGVLEKSTDKKSISFMIGKTTTVGLVGMHKVLVSLGASDNAEMSDVIAEYDIEYSARVAG